MSSSPLSDLLLSVDEVIQTAEDMPSRDRLETAILLSKMLSLDTRLISFFRGHHKTMAFIEALKTLLLNWEGYQLGLHGNCLKLFDFMINHTKNVNLSDLIDGELISMFWHYSLFTRFGTMAFGLLNFLVRNSVCTEARILEIGLELSEINMSKNSFIIDPAFATTGALLPKGGPPSFAAPQVQPKVILIPSVNFYSLIRFWGPSLGVRPIGTSKMSRDISRGDLTLQLKILQMFNKCINFVEISHNSKYPVKFLVASIANYSAQFEKYVSELARIDAVTKSSTARSSTTSSSSSSSGGGNGDNTAEFAIRKTVGAISSTSFSSSKDSNPIFTTIRSHDDHLLDIDIILLILNNIFAAIKSVQGIGHLCGQTVLEYKQQGLFRALVSLVGCILGTYLHLEAFRSLEESTKAQVFHLSSQIVELIVRICSYSIGHKEVFEEVVRLLDSHKIYNKLMHCYKLSDPYSLNNYDILQEATRLLSLAFSSSTPLIHIDFIQFVWIRASEYLTDFCDRYMSSDPENNALNEYSIISVSRLYFVLINGFDGLDVSSNPSSRAISTAVSTALSKALKILKTDSIPVKQDWVWHIANCVHHLCKYKNFSELYLAPSIKVPERILVACSKLNPNLHDLLLHSPDSTGLELDADDDVNNLDPSELDSLGDIERDRMSLSEQSSSDSEEIANISGNFTVIVDDVSYQSQAFVEANLEKIYISMILTTGRCIDNLGITKINVKDFLRVLLEIAIIGLSVESLGRFIEGPQSALMSLSLMSIRIISILVKKFPDTDFLDDIMQSASKVLILKRIANLSEVPWYTFPLFNLLVVICKNGDELIRRKFIKKLNNVFYQLERLYMNHAVVPCMLLIDELSDVLHKVDGSGEMLTVSLLIRAVRMQHLPKIQLLACKVIFDIGKDNPGLIHNGIGRRETEDALYVLLNNPKIYNDYDSLYYVLGASTVCIKNLNPKPRWTCRPWMYSWRAYQGGLIDRMLLQAETAAIVARLMRRGRGLYILPIFSQALAFAVASMYNCTDGVIQSFSPKSRKSISGNNLALLDVLNDQQTHSTYLKASLTQLILPCLVSALEVISLGSSTLDEDESSSMRSGSFSSNHSIISMLEAEERSTPGTSGDPNYRNTELFDDSEKVAYGKNMMTSTSSASKSFDRRDNGSSGMKVSLSENNLAAFAKVSPRGTLRPEIKNSDPKALTKGKVLTPTSKMMHRPNSPTIEVGMGSKSNRSRGSSEDANEKTSRRIFWNRNFYADTKNRQNEVIELLAERTVDALFCYLCLEDMFPMSTYLLNQPLFRRVPIIANLSNVMSRFPTNAMILKRGLEIFKCFAENNLELTALAIKSSPACLVAITSQCSDISCQILFCKIAAAIGNADDFAIESAVRYGMHVPIYEFILQSGYPKVAIEACRALSSLCKSQDSVDALCFNGMDFLDAVIEFLTHFPHDKCVQVEGLVAITALTKSSKQVFKAKHLIQYKKTIKYLKELSLQESNLLPEYTKDHVEALLHSSVKQQKGCVIS